MGSVLPVVICIDVEPDERETVRGESSEWSGYLGLYEVLGALRPKLPGPSGPGRYAWFFRLDPQIAATYGSPAWGLRAYRHRVDRSLAGGDDIGAHVHPYRWSDEHRSWIADFGNQEWVEHSIDTSLEAFHAELDTACVSVRLGDHWMNDDTVDLLERRGIRYDLTLEPGMPPMRGLVRTAHRTGMLPDLTTMPREPYRPSRRDFRKADTGRHDGLWIIPVTTGRLGHGLARLRAIGRRILRPGWATPAEVALNPALSPVLFRSLLSRTLQAPETRHLALAVRSDAGHDRRRNVERNVEWLVAHARGRELVFCTPREAVAVIG